MVNYSENPRKVNPVLAVRKNSLRTSLVICDNLEGWDSEGGREAQEGRDMGIYVCIWLIHSNTVL